MHCGNLDEDGRKPFGHLHKTYTLFDDKEVSEGKTTHRMSDEQIQIYQLF